MPGLIEAVRVGIVCVLEAHGLSSVVHPGHEAVDGPAANRFGNGQRGVVARVQQQAIQGVLQRQRVTGIEADDRRLGQRSLGCPDGIGESGMIQRDERGHHLRQAGRRQTCVSIA